MHKRFTFIELRKIDISKVDVLVNNTFDTKGVLHKTFLIKTIKDEYKTYDVPRDIGFAPEGITKDILCAAMELNIDDMEQIAEFIRNYGYFTQTPTEEYKEFTLEEIQEQLRYIRQITELTSLYIRYNEGDKDFGALKEATKDLSELFTEREEIQEAFKDNIDSNKAEIVLNKLKEQINSYVVKAHAKLRYVDGELLKGICFEPENDLMVAIHLELICMFDYKIICKRCYKEGCPDSGKYAFLLPIEGPYKGCADRKCRIRMHKRIYDAKNKK